MKKQKFLFQPYEKLSLSKLKQFAALHNLSEGFAEYLYNFYTLTDEYQNVRLWDSYILSQLDERVKNFSFLEWLRVREKKASMERFKEYNPLSYQMFYPDDPLSNI
jgi:hypothetical protein